MNFLSESGCSKYRLAKRTAGSAAGEVPEEAVKKTPVVSFAARSDCYHSATCTAVLALEMSQILPATD